MSRLDVQTWVQAWESSIPDWRLKIEDFPGLSLENLQSRIEDWRFSRTLPRESSIPDWRLKIEDFPGLSLENLQSRIEDWRFSPGLKILQQESWGIFNLQSRIKDSPTRVLRNLQSSIFNPGLKILQQDSCGIFNLQSSILDWRFSNKAPGESSIFNLQSWTSSLRSFCTWGIWSIFVKGLRLHLHSTVCSSRPEALPLCLQSTYRTRCRSQCKAVSPWRTTRHW